MGLKKWPSGFPGTCPDCGEKIGPNDPRYRAGNDIFCVKDGAKRIAEEYRTPQKAAPAPVSPSKAQSPVPEPKTPTGAVLPPPVTKNGGLPGQTDAQPPARVCLGLRIGLPGFSEARASFDMPGEPGETPEALADRVQASLLHRLAGLAEITLSASKDPVAFIRDYGQQVEQTAAAPVG
jgi:hypothetical protein